GGERRGGAAVPRVARLRAERRHERVDRGAEQRRTHVAPRWEGHAPPARTEGRPHPRLRFRGRRRPRRLPWRLPRRRFLGSLRGKEPLVIAASLVNSIVDWFGPLYQGVLGYLIVAGIIFLDRGALTGVIIPGDLFLALGGIYAGR